MHQLDFRGGTTPSINPVGEEEGCAALACGLLVFEMFALDSFFTRHFLPVVDNKAETSQKSMSPCVFH